jgi:hopanoid-associated phosphorylase
MGAPIDRPILVVVGLRMEATLLPSSHRIVIGVDPVRLAEAAEGACAVLSFGIAGGLDPALACGDLVVATRVCGGRGVFLADPAWAVALAQATGARLGPLAGAADVVAHPAAKRALAAATNALAVDMESEAAAALAAARDLPFAAVRAIADTAADRVPQAALVGFRSDGRTTPGRVALALLRRPAELTELVRTAKRASLALAALRRVVVSFPQPA